MRAPFSQWANSAFQAGAVGEIARRIRALPAAIGNGLARLRGKTVAEETAAREGAPSGPDDAGGEEPKLPQTAAEAEFSRRKNPWLFRAGLILVIVSIFWTFTTYLVLTGLTTIRPTHEVVVN